MRKAGAVFLFLLLATSAAAQTRLLVTVLEKKTQQPITGLRAADFSVSAGKARRVVRECVYRQEPADLVLLLDSSAIGEPISRLAPDLIRQLGKKEQMSIVSFDTSAEVIQEFTSSRETLLDALKRIHYGNSPLLSDAVYATAADGFEDAAYRRVMLLLTSGVDGPSRVKFEDLIRVCRRNQVSVFAVHMMRFGRARLEKLARLTGGAAYGIKELSKETSDPAATVFAAIRGHYILTVDGNAPLGGDATVELSSRPGKRTFVSYLELE